MPIVLKAGKTYQLNTQLQPSPSEFSSLEGMSTELESGQPVASALVEVGSAASGYTNSSGYFFIGEIVPGTYPVTISATGYETLVV